MPTDADASLRLFVDPPLDGPTNMAVDACLLREARAGGPGTLRLYRWHPATLSLGYFQSVAELETLGSELARLPRVRRCTGGGAILHADELTYSLTLPAGHVLAGGSPESLYVWMHRRILDALARLGAQAAFKGAGSAGGRSGPFLCFARHAPFDLVGGADKLAGSAQRRTRDGLLQHGSLVLRRTHPIQPSSAVDEQVGRRVGFEEMTHALVAAFVAAGLPLPPPTPSRVDQDEFHRQHAIFAGAEWTCRR